MAKKILGMVAAGMLSLGSVANASIVTPTYDSSWQTFSYDSAVIGQTMIIGVSDVWGDTTGNSILNLSNLVGLNLLSGFGITSGTDPLVLETGEGDALGGTACEFYVQSPGPAVGGDCSVFIFEITATTVSADWQMAQWDNSMTSVNGSDASDFAFFGTTDGNDGGVDGYLIPMVPTSSCTAAAGCDNPKIPEPSTIALMAMGLLGAGFAVRRRQI